MLTLISPPGFEKLFDAVAEQGEEALLADPERLVALATRFGTEVLGDYPTRPGACRGETDRPATRFGRWTSPCWPCSS